MIRMSLSSALGAASEKNAALTTAYREGAHRFLSRSAATLASSMADQRREAGKELIAIIAESGSTAEIDLDLSDPSLMRIPSLPPPSDDVAALLSAMKKSEAEDYEFLAAIAGAALPAAPSVAERVASLAEEARKRASWAQDHLELLGIA